MTSAAALPRSTNATSRCPMLTSKGGRDCSAAFNLCCSLLSCSGGPSSSHSSGPRHRAASPSRSMTRPTFRASSSANAAPAACAIASLPRSTKRATGPVRSTVRPRKVATGDAGARAKCRETALVIASGTQALSRRIEENGSNEVDCRAALRHRNEKPVADLSSAVCYETERDRPPQRFAPIGGCHVTQRRRARGRIGTFGDLRALLELRRGVGREQTDQLAAARADEVRQRQRSLADEIALCLADCPIEAKICDGHRAIRVLVYNDVAFFRAQHVHGLRAVRAATKLLDRGDKLLPNCPAVLCRNIDLEAELAGKAHTKQATLHPTNAALLHAHMGQSVERDTAQERRNHLTRAWALHRDQRPLVGDGGQPYV